MVFSVIIPTYNRVEKLQKCLSSIVSQKFSSEDYEIIIVDDCSKDNTEDFCNDFVKEKNNIRYIKNRINKGRCVTRNEGIRVSKGFYLVFLDNDLVVEDNFLQTQLDFFKKNSDKKIAIINNTSYPPAILSKSNFGTFIQSRAIGYRSERDMVSIDMRNVPANYFAGGGSSIKREDAFSVGLFEESLGKYGSEDELFGHRFIASGGQIMYCDETKILHDDNDVSPRFWKVKFMELGHYGLRMLAEKEADLVDSTLYSYVMPIDRKRDGLVKSLKKIFINIMCQNIFRVPIEKYVFHTDDKKMFKNFFFYRYLTLAWIRSGFQSNKPLGEVKY